ncbi:hypothetical protein COU74_03625 [Candidatus Peregrinibacteria bacterium CG10_big_fil_rev_8_21_14_0_10_36_19]|nr:MAG: hypothetical protein COU74_03625 [Candidatus Peregrinibacteria bacterium CG10_big_fil_rev_8_21_14_0_10_36_19]
MLVYVLLFFPVALSFGFFQTFFNEAFYKGDFVDVMYEFAVFEIPMHIDEDLRAQYLLEDEDVENILRSVFDKADLALVIDSFITEIKNATVDAEGDLELRFPLKWLTNKNDLVADELADLYISKLDKCSDDIEDFDGEKACLPVGFSKMDVKSKLKSSLDIGLLSNVPDEFGYTVSLPSFFEGNLFLFFRNLMNVFFLFGGLLLAFVLMLIALIVNSPKIRVLKWVSKTVFFAAFIFVLALLTFLFLPKNLVSESAAIYSRFYSFMMSSLLKEVSYYLFPLLFVSFGLWVYGIIADKGKHKYDL